MNSPNSRESTSPVASTSTNPNPGRARDSYADVGLAVRYSRAQLEASQPTTFTRRVWEAVAVDLLASWSRLTEARDHLTRDICRLIGLNPDSRGNRSKVGTALAACRDAAALGYRPATGAERAVVTLPAPPDSWVDPTCGMTAGELRTRRRCTAQTSPAPPATRPSPTRPVARNEKPGEQPPSTAPTGPDTPAAGTTGGQGQTSHLDDQAQALRDELLSLLPPAVARHAQPRRQILLSPCREALEAGHTARTLLNAVLAHDRRRGPLDALNDPAGTAGAVAWRIRNAEPPPSRRAPASDSATACGTCEGRPLVERDDGTWGPCACRQRTG